MSGEFPNEAQVNCGVTLLVTRDPPCTGKGCTPAVDSRLTLVKTNSCLAQVKDGVVTLKRDMEVVASIDNVSIGNKVTTEYELTANVKNVKCLRRGRAHRNKRGYDLESSHNVVQSIDSMTESGS
jgi:hypothetical protein